jgi:hypothetical protein
MPDIYPVQIVAILPKSTLFIQISNENTYFRSHDHLFLPISITDGVDKKNYWKILHRKIPVDASALIFIFFFAREIDFTVTII